MDVAPGFVDAVKRPVHGRAATGDVIAVVREMLAGREARRFAHNLVPLDDQLAAVLMANDPLATEQRDCPVGIVADRDEIDERVRLALRQTVAALVVNQSVQLGGETRNLDRRLRHA